MAIIPLWLGEARRRLMTGDESVPVQQGRPVLFEGLFQRHPRLRDSPERYHVLRL